MGAACSCGKPKPDAEQPTATSAAPPTANGELPAPAQVQAHARRAPSRASSMAGNVYFDAEDGDLQGHQGVNAAPNPGLNAYLASSQQRSFGRAMSRGSVMSGTTAFEDALEELPDDATSRRTSVRGGSDDEKSPERLGSLGEVPAAPRSSTAGASEDGTLRRKWDAEAHQEGAGAMASGSSLTQRASSLRDSFMRASMTFGSTKPKHPEVQPSPARVDPAQYDEAVLALSRKLLNGSWSCVADAPLLPVAPWNRHPGYLGHLSKEQEAALAAMRDWFPGSARFHTDHDLLRFLRARDFNLDATRSMYQNYLTIYWEKLLISPVPMVRPTIGDWPLHLLDGFPQRPGFATEQMRGIMDYFLHSMVFHTDRLGRPVVYLRVADMVHNQLGARVALAERILMQSASIETNRLLCMMASARAGFQIEDFMQVIDLGGVSTVAMMKHQRSPENQSEWAHNADYNPETLGKIVIINAPFGSGAVWKVASLVLPPRTREKVSICSSTYKAELIKLIEPDKLPSCYGGKVPFEWPKHKDISQFKATSSPS